MDKESVVHTHNGKFSSVQFSRSVMSDSLQPHESQNARPSCPSPTPGVYPNSCPSSQWCHPAISSPVIPFSSCPQSLPTSESFPMSQLFTWGRQSIGVSASASVSPSNEHPGLISFRIDWLDLLAVQSLKRECSYLSNCKLLKASHVFIWGMRKKLSTKIGIKGQQWGRANLLSIYTLIKLNSVKYLTEEGLQLFLSSVFFFLSSLLFWSVSFSRLNLKFLENS